MTAASGRERVCCNTHPSRHPSKLVEDRVGTHGALRRAQLLDHWRRCSQLQQVCPQVEPLTCGGRRGGAQQAGNGEGGGRACAACRGGVTHGRRPVAQRQQWQGCVRQNLAAHTCVWSAGGHGGGGTARAPPRTPVSVGRKAGGRAGLPHGHWSPPRWAVVATLRCGAGTAGTPEPHTRAGRAQVKSPRAASSPRRGGR